MDTTKKFDTILRLIRQHHAEEAMEQLAMLKKSGTMEQGRLWRIHELYGACFHDIGDAEGAAQAYWNAMQSDIYLRSQREHLSNYLFCLHYLPHLSDTVLFQQHLLAAKLYAEKGSNDKILPSGDERQPLRIGFLAPDFCEQAAASFFAVPICGLAALGWNVRCYSLSPQEDELTAKIKKSHAALISLDGMDLASAAERIRADQLAILFDLGGHSAGGMTLMLSAMRLAPCQICGIGWFDTTGIPAVDAFLADDASAPAAADAFFTEQLLRLPHQFCYRPRPELSALPAKSPKLRNPIVFGSFNNYMKITDDMLHLWQEILDALPNAKLVLKDTTPFPSRQSHMKERLSSLGIDGSRIELRPASKDYLREYAGIDILLDTFPYPGGATTCEALYMGVPVITLAGTRYSSRMGASLLFAANLSEWIAFSEEEYIKYAVRLAQNTEELRHWQKHLRAHLLAAPLMDEKRYVKDFAHALYSLQGK